MYHARGVVARGTHSLHNPQEANRCSNTCACVGVSGISDLLTIVYHAETWGASGFTISSHEQMAHARGAHTEKCNPPSYTESYAGTSGCVRLHRIYTTRRGLFREGKMRTYVLACTGGRMRRRTRVRAWGGECRANVCSGKAQEGVVVKRPIFSRARLHIPFTFWRRVFWGSGTREAQLKIFVKSGGGVFIEVHKKFTNGRCARHTPPSIRKIAIPYHRQSEKSPFYKKFLRFVYKM